MTTACSKCGVRKPRNSDHFVSAPTCADGLSNVCRVCRAAYHRDWKHRNRESLLARRRRLYRESEKTIEAARVRERWKKDPARKRAQILRSGMLERSKASGLRWDGDVFTVPFIAAWLREQRACECCGSVLRLVPIDGRKGNQSPSMDRVDPGQGYVVGNVALLCWRCNNLKRDASAGELETIAAWMRSRSAHGNEAPS